VTLSANKPSLGLWLNTGRKAAVLLQKAAANQRAPKWIDGVDVEGLRLRAKLLWAPTTKVGDPCHAPSASAAVDELLSSPSYISSPQISLTSSSHPSTYHIHPRDSKSLNLHQLQTFLHPHP
jgi:hypothetical protein